MDEDRRIRPRYDVRFPVTLVTPRGVVKGETRNLSRHGAFICCREPLNPKERLLLLLQLPTGSPLNLSAQVIWSNASASEERGTPPGMGVRFLW